MTAPVASIKRALPRVSDDFLKLDQNYKRVVSVISAALSLAGFNTAMGEYTVQQLGNYGRFTYIMSKKHFSTTIGMEPVIQALKQLGIKTEMKDTNMRRFRVYLNVPLHLLEKHLPQALYDKAVRMSPQFENEPLPVRTKAPVPVATAVAVSNIPNVSATNGSVKHMTVVKGPTNDAEVLALITKIAKEHKATISGTQNSDKDRYLKVVILGGSMDEVISLIAAFRAAGIGLDVSAPRSSKDPSGRKVRFLKFGLEEAEVVDWRFRSRKKTVGNGSVRSISASSTTDTVPTTNAIGPVATQPSMESVGLKTEEQILKLIKKVAKAHRIKTSVFKNPDETRYIRAVHVIGATDRDMVRYIEAFRSAGVLLDESAPRSSKDLIGRRIKFLRPGLVERPAEDWRVKPKSKDQIGATEHGLASLLVRALSSAGYGIYRTNDSIRSIPYSGGMIIEANGLSHTDMVGAVAKALEQQHEEN